MRSIKRIVLNIIMVLLYICCTKCYGQNPLPVGWQNLDLKDHMIFGISADKSYSAILNNRPVDTPIVAIIDGGIDIKHQDLKKSLWINNKEIPNNGKDDDENGYIDDIYGWNYLGTKNGSFHIDNAEMVRLLRLELKKDPGSSESSQLSLDLEKGRTRIQRELNDLKSLKMGLLRIKQTFNNASPSLNELKLYKYNKEYELRALLQLVENMKSTNGDLNDFLRDTDKRILIYEHQIQYVLNIKYNPRKNSKAFSTNGYGNPDVIGNEPSHGTHAAGIVGAIRNNEIGINGIANPVKIMCLLAIPEGDMLDKDLANAIFYAVRNGARIISLSFNKQISPQKKEVDSAVKYAMDNDVLIIHSSGNEGRAESEEGSYPNRYFDGGGIAEAWLEVGASGPYDNETLLAPFSNYGKNTTDVFAPGVKITSLSPGDKTEVMSGTSMAVPVVAGLAAMLRAYYPALTAIRIKEIIMKSVTKVDHKVRDRFGELLDFSETCMSGGIVNMNKAMEMAAEESRTSEN